MDNSKRKQLLYLGAFAALLPVLIFRDFTPSNELRYLSIADEALSNNTFFAFTNHGLPYADKPPLYLWAIMLCRWITGGHRMWLLALFSILPAFGIVHIMDRWTAQEMDEKNRSLARLMLLTCGLFVGVAVTLRMDMLMCFFIVLALRSFWRMFKNEGNYWREAWLFPIYLFLATFTKGPLGLFIPFCSTIVFLAVSRHIREFFRYWGWRTWGVLIFLCTFWFLAVYIEGGNEYLHNLLFKQTVGRAVNSFHHAEPFYYYAVSIWYILAPWALLAIGTVAAALRPKFMRSELQVYFLSVIITVFVLLSAISSKLQIYILPAIPFFIYVAALLLPRFRENVWVRLSIAVPAAIFSLAVPALLIVVKKIPEEMPYLNNVFFYAAAAILTLSGAYSLYHLYGKKCTAGVTGAILTIAIGMFFAIFAGGFAIPEMNQYTGYGALCEKAMEISEAQGITDIRTWHISRPENMDVYLHRRVAIIDNDDVPEADERPYLLLTNKKYLENFPEYEARVTGLYAVVVCR